MSLFLLGLINALSLRTFSKRGDPSARFLLKSRFFLKNRPENRRISNSVNSLNWRRLDTMELNDILALQGIIK